MNRACLVGNVVRDPMSKRIGDYTMTLFTIAVRQTKDKTNFIDCEAWGKTAELVRDYAKKGRMISVDGFIKAGMVDGKNPGERIYRMVVSAQSIGFVGRQPDDQESARKRSAPVSIDKADTEDDLLDDIPF